jgi:hypothetical protein
MRRRYPHSVCSLHHLDLFALFVEFRYTKIVPAKKAFLSQASYLTTTTLN